MPDYSLVRIIFWPKKKNGTKCVPSQVVFSFTRGKYLKTDGSKGDEVVEKLAKIYHGKCAYCEERTLIYIEHYRPKGSVQGSRHGGYYWLCLEWSNLLPACHECNKIGGGKAK